VVAQQPAFQPLAQPTGMSSTGSANVPAPAAVQPAAPAVTPAAPAAQPAAPVTPAPQAQVNVSAQPATPPVTTVTTTTTTQPEPAVVIQQEAPEPAYNPAHPASSDKSSFVVEPSELVRVNQRLTQVTQENAKIQEDYKQKIATYEVQNSELQNKIQTLNARLAGL
jgi:hypothetical protein